ncbi:MAG: ATP-binding cassette domain-containing protein [Myxococcota bacterium]
MTTLIADHVRKRYGQVDVLQDVCLHVRGGETVALLGPSGRGKSTLLRCLAGLEPPTSGRVAVSGRVGLVLQQLYLFPHMTVWRNVTYAPLRAHRLPKEEVEKRAHDLLDRMQLEDKKDVFPASLSGGQKQRVAIARALAIQPDVLLLDEPTSALDAARSQSVWRIIRQAAGPLASIIVVTHDTDLARQVADRVLTLRDGCLSDAA